MTSPGEQLRDALEGWHRGQAQERLWRWRDSAHAVSRADALKDRDWLLGRHAWEAFSEAASTGELDPVSAEAMARHLGEAAACRAWAPALDALEARARAPVDVGGHGLSLSELMRELEHTGAATRRAELAGALDAHLQPLLGRLADASRAAEHARRQARSPEREQAEGRTLEATRALAERVLAETAGLAEEARARLLANERSPTIAWHTLWRALREPTLDGLVPARDRWRRLARSLQAFGVQRELDAHLRAEPDHGLPSPHVELAALDVPRDVRLAPSRMERGALSEHEAMAGLGRGLAGVLCNAALPVELRRPADPGVADALGALLAQLLADGVYLRRAHGQDGAAAPALQRHVASVQVVQVRLEAAWLKASCAAEEDGVEARAERGRHGLHEALGIEAPAFWGAALTLDPTRAARRFRARVVGLALHVGLRDAWDEDWFRNPRIAEPLRAACAQGGLLDADTWCQQTGVAPDACLARLGELLA